MLAVYGDTLGTMQLVAPQGWNCNASIGADGGTYVDVYPPGQGDFSGYAFSPHQGAGITGGTTSACQGCAFDQACALFAGTTLIRDSGYQSCGNTRPSEEGIYNYNENVRFIDDPPGVTGDGFPSGGSLPANGVMTYFPGSQFGSWTETCTLPSSQHAVCTLILNQFLSQYGNR